MRLKFDENYPMTGGMKPPGFTLSLTRTGSSSFDATYKQESKPVWTAKWTVSEDGNTLTVVESVPGAENLRPTDSKTGVVVERWSGAEAENKAVFERQ